MASGNVNVTSASTWHEFDDILITVIEQYPVLYDMSLKEFQNSTLKENVLLHVSLVLVHRLPPAQQYHKINTQVWNNNRKSCTCIAV